MTLDRVYFRLRTAEGAAAEEDGAAYGHVAEDGTAGRACNRWGHVRDSG